MLSCCFVLRALEWGITDVDFAVFTPVFGLKKGYPVSESLTWIKIGIRGVLTVDFQYSDIVTLSRE